jgi:hypothetical protein
LGERVDRSGEAVVAQRHRLEVEGEVTELADRRPRPAERPVEDLARLLEVAAPDEVERGVEHERDAGERLHRPVVEEEGDPPAFVLLRREDVLGQLAVGVVDGRAPGASR